MYESFDNIFSVCDDVVTIDSRLAHHIEETLGYRQPLDVPVRTGILRIEIVPFRPLPNPRNYTPVSVNCNISSTSLGEAARLLGPAFVYDLYVNPYLLIDTRSVLRRMQPTEFSDNPLYPHLNLHPDDSLSRWEWYLAANGKGAGSKGV